MPQVSWIYNTSEGQRYQVGLYHGDTSRHLLIYSQSNIIKIDFNVDRDTTYSFMLGEDLVTLKIYWIESVPHYTLNEDRPSLINQKSTKPWNDIIKAVLLLLVLVNIIVMLMIYLMK
jgi:hypothetical protein